MATLTPTELELGFQQLLSLARQNSALETELASSVGDFFPQMSAPQELRGDDLLNARRHQEWFLFERHSAHLEGVPCERLLGEWRKAVAEQLQEHEVGERALLDSCAGIFSVRGVAEDGAAWLEDLGCLQEHSLRPNPEAPSLDIGDLIVGRLHPDGDGAVLASPAAGVFRNSDLHQAIEADLARRRSDGGPALLRFDQQTLEQAFFCLTQDPALDAESPTAVNPLDSAMALLGKAGLSEAAIQDIFARLRSTPMQAKSLVLGSDDHLGEILDELAFDTEVDLTRARAALATAWHSLRLDSAERRTSPREVTNALADFDQGRAQGRDVQALLDDLERDLGLGESGSEGAEPVSSLPSGGVARAIVTEFRWEAQASKEIQLTREQLESLDLLIEFGAGFEQPEELGAQAMRQFLFFWCPEQRVKPTQVANLVPALEAFCQWASQEQDLEVDDWQGSDGEFLVDLERILDLNQSLPRRPDQDGELFEVLEAEDPRGLPGLMVSIPGGMPFRTEIKSEALRAAQQGDLLRAKLLDDSQLEIRSVYPGSAHRLDA
ncbi:MAG TPA: hypothetical protein EYQ25_13540 [Planctomycetes bacterium]|nr:hypothetical protein [Planctomycetota bacterium]HIL38559.1 hypothetical protein [Planctomycetota bacterium]